MYRYALMNGTLIDGSGAAPVFFRLAETLPQHLPADEQQKDQCDPGDEPAERPESPEHRFLQGVFRVLAAAQKAVAGKVYFFFKLQ